MTACIGNCLFVLSFFPLDVLDEILDLDESVSEGFPTYSFITLILQLADLFKITEHAQCIT